MSTRGETHSVSAHRNPRGQGVERGFTAAFELVATPALFGVIGYFIDSRLGSGPWLTIGLTAVVASYLVWKLWYQYNAEMLELEAELIGRRSGQTPRLED